MDMTSQKRSVSAFFGGSDIVVVTGGRTESCFSHFERGEDPGVNESVHAFSAYNLYQLAQKDKSQITVDELGSRFGR